MRERFKAVSLALLAISVSACAADAPSDEGRGDPRAEQVLDHQLAAMAGVAPAQSDDADLELQNPQASIFGVGTSCSPNPCRNGGTCADQFIGYICICPPGFSGTECQDASKNCGPLPPPPNGRVSTPNGTGLGAVARYECASKLVLTGPNTRTCGANGWSGTAPSCVPQIACGNGIVDSGEPCDPSAPGRLNSRWSCNDNCSWKTSYNACTSATCANGEVCLAGFCTKACQGSTANCPATPSGGVAQPLCLRERNPTAYDVCAAVNCRTRADCAPGLGCYTVDGFSFCAACSSNNVGTCN